MSKHNQIVPPTKSLADIIKDDSHIMSLAIEDGTERRDNWTEFFDTLGSFLKSWNMKVVGIDKIVFAKMTQERIQRLAQAAENIVTEESANVENIQTEKTDATSKEVILAKS